MSEGRTNQEVKSASPRKIPFAFSQNNNKRKRPSKQQPELEATMLVKDSAATIPSPPMKKVRSVGALEFDLYANKRNNKHMRLAASEFSIRASSSTCRKDSLMAAVDNGSEKTNNASPMRKVASWSGPHPPSRRRRSCLPTFVPEQEAEVEERTFSLSSLPRLLAKLSVVALVIAAIADLTPQSGTSYLFHSSSSSVSRPALGSAAITSVTETLSPILPFTGGIDLRKEDYWTASSPLKSVQSITKQVWEAFSAQPAAVDVQNTHNLKQSSSRKIIPHSSTLSASDCFVPLAEIAQLTLADISQIIRYSMEINHSNFDEHRFVGRQLPRVKKAIQTLKQAVQKSRGRGVELSVVKPDKKQASAGSTDALMFGAAMRVFGEWRMVRQVPEGYKGYAVGMNLGLKDIVQNVGKLETAVHGWLDTVGPLDGGVIRSPTLAQLMEYEAKSGVHPSLPRLKDRTGAMGLLWVRRQLQYQTSIFDNFMQGPKRFATTTDAVSAAYDEVYNRYHGWAVQKIFSYSFQSAPEAEVIFMHMNPHKLKELQESKLPISEMEETDGTAEDGKTKEETNPVVLWWKNVERDLENNPVVLWWKNVEKDLESNPVVSWFKKVGDDTKRIVDDIREKIQPQKTGGVRVGSASSSAAEKYIAQEMTKDAKENIAKYLETTRPLLDDLKRAFDKYNMDDPTKV